MSSKTSNGSIKVRNFGTIVYPDSVAKNWLDLLTETHIPVFISPLHDKDINPDGTLKKPHWHVMIMFDSQKSQEQGKEIISLIHGVGQEIVQSTRGYARYLCHLDNPEKHQYRQEDVKQLNGADYGAVIGLATDKYKALGEMEDFCDRYNVTSFYALSKYARTHNIGWYRVLCDCGTIYMTKWLASKKWSQDTNTGTIFDPVSGEIIME